VSPYDANVPTPLVSGDAVYVASAGTGGGMLRLKAVEGGIQPEELYFDAKLPAAIGGVVRVGDYLYGTTSQAMLAFDFGTGEVKWQDRALGAASLLLADDRLYLHGENGEVALVEPSPERYIEKGHFTPSNPPEHANTKSKAWAYPVVADGRLYIRDENALWCYDVRAGR
jgi:outer membrane protein assembly factor BamB